MCVGAYQQRNLAIATPSRTCAAVQGKYGTHTTINDRFWPWLSGKRHSNRVPCSLGSGPAEELGHGHAVAHVRCPHPFLLRVVLPRLRKIQYFNAEDLNATIHNSHTHVRQSTPDSGLDFQAEVLDTS